MGAVGLNQEESEQQSYNEIIAAQKVEAVDEVGQKKDLYSYTIISDKALSVGRCNLNQ